MNTKRSADPTFVTEQVRVCERRLAELQKQRAEVLLDLADNPDDENVHASIDSHDQHIKRVQDRIENLNASLTEAGRRDAEAFAKRLREEAGALNDKALTLVYGARQEAAVGVDAAVAALINAIERYNALGKEAGELVNTGLRPLCDGLQWRRSHITELARAPHGTLSALLDTLLSRDVRAMRMREHADKMAAALDAAIARVNQEIDAKAA